MDDQPTPIVKLSQAREYAQLLSNFALKHPFKVFSYKCDEHTICHE